jgi:DNA invertase Pin-like site-specific DNA recombinase
MTRAKKIEAREYLRVSKDQSGRERSIEEQHEANVEFARAQGWKLGKPYRDVGSASRHARGNGRDAFEHLMADLRDGSFGADVLVLWEPSRGSRRVSEWVALIEACQQRGVQIGVTSHGHVYDTSNGRDRRSLHEDATDSEYESDKLSMRLKRAAAANAAAGRPSGTCPYGYRRLYDPVSRKLDRQEPHPDEAPVVVELYERLAAGHSLRSISRDFEQRGIRSRSGRVFGPATLRAMATMPAYAGLRVHLAGSRSRQERERDGVLTEAVWPGLVSRSLWLAVKHKLSDPSRRTTRPGRAVHLLSMIARCHVCGDVVVATYRGDGHGHQRGVRSYQCRSGGHIRVDADDLDRYAEDKLLAFLSQPEHVEALFADERDDEAIEHARELVASIRAELDDLADQVGRGALSASLAARAEPQLLTRLAEAQRQVDTLSTPSTLTALIEPGAKVAEQWSRSPMAVKRQLARLLLTRDVLGELRVQRCPPGGNRRVPIAERVLFGLTD